MGTRLLLPPAAPRAPGPPTGDREAASPPPLRRSLRARVALFVGLVVAITAGAVGAVGYAATRRALDDQIRARLLAVAEHRGELIEAYLVQHGERAGLVASRTRLRALLAELAAGTLAPADFRAEAEPILRDAAASSPEFLACSVANPAGRVVASSDPDEVGRDLASDRDFLAGRADRHVGRPQTGPGGLVTQVAAPARDGAGRLLGVILVRLDGQPLRELLGDRHGVGEGSEVLLAWESDRAGWIEVLVPRSGRGALPPAESWPLRVALSGERRAVRARMGERELLAAGRPVEHPDGERWGLVATRELTAAYRPLERLRWQLLGLQGALLLAGVGTSAWLARRHVRPVLRLAAGARAVGRGDLGARVPVESADELGTLAGAFNGMVARLEQAHATLEQRVEERTRQLARANERLQHEVDERRRAEAALAASRERARTSLEAALDAFVAIDEHSVITAWNRRAEEVFGWSADEAIGRSLLETILPERYHHDHLRGMARFLARGEGTILGRRVELVARRRDGSELPVELSLAQPVRVGGGHHFSAFVRDITRRRRAEEAALRHARELERSNADLEQFAYVASHDLQEPLRAIASFSELLELDHAERLDEEGRDLLRRSQEAAHRMQELLRGLLDYSRVSTRGVAPRPTDSGEVLEEAIALLEAAVRESGATIERVPPLPRVAADRTQLLQVFQNLLGNALKFRRPGEPPWVRVSAGPEGDGMWRFSVQDRGIGIPPEQAERVFVIFQRLHTRDEYPGTGLGLAICHKIVERHGGRIWVESTPGQGSTFHFTLPGEAGAGEGPGA